MSFTISFTGQFKKDYKVIVKRKYDLTKLEMVYKILEETGTLPITKYKTHILKGNYAGNYEAHIEPDWLLIWIKEKTEIIFVRTGTHSDLFK